VLGEAHLRRVLREYFAQYHDSRLHQSLHGNAPRPREIEPPSQGSWPSPRSGASTTATSALPEYRSASSPESVSLRAAVARRPEQRRTRNGSRRIPIAVGASHLSVNRSPARAPRFAPR
jgi:hypothetical protein